MSISRSSNKSVCVSTAGGVENPLSLNDPLIAAMARGDLLWGDLCIDVYPVSTNSVSVPVRSVPVRPVRSEEELFTQSFSRDMDMHFTGMYDTATMSDSDYEALMTWLCESGWDIVSEHRRSVHAFPDNLPSRVWIAPSRFELAAQADTGCCSGHKHAPNPKKRAAIPIPRFCKAAAACTEEGCRYIHEDSMPRLNQPCSFGAECGATDATGIKRSQCLRMHPGETWTSSLVITRPVPASTP
jgi:hypothetical protein